MSTPKIKISGRPVPLAKKIGKGGEGEIYAVEGKAEQAIKVYHESLRAQREPKVRAMVDGGIARSTELVAFPSAIATDPFGAFIGFRMHRVPGFPLHELYSPKSRKTHFPKADYRFLVRAALNVANAVVKVHQTGCIIGDFNHSGVLVSDKATVSLIDADSFQFTNGRQTFPCIVGVPDFTPPELHGADLSRTPRTELHDNFGLAVAVFHLLAMGKHPYAGRFAGGDLSMNDAIAQHRFAYSEVRKSETRTTPPPASVTLNDFPPQIASAFEAAFGRNPTVRPSAMTWSALLKELEGAISHCSQVRTHYYPSAAGKCVWCRIAGQSGVDMFPDLSGASAAATSGAPFDIERIFSQLNAIKLPASKSFLPAFTGTVSDPGEAALAASRARKVKRAQWATVVLAMWVAFFAAPQIALIWIAGGIFGLIRLFGVSIDEDEFRRAYSQRDTKVRGLELALIQHIGIDELAAVRSNLEQWIEEYRGLDRGEANDVQRLKATRETRKREAFLDRYLIRRAAIPGIGPAKISTLASFGVETAADVKWDRVMAVPGFGEALTSKLVAWRRGCEGLFRYNPVSDASDIQAEAAVRANWAAKRRDLQTKIVSALAGLQRGVAQIRTRAEGHEAPLVSALQEREQAAFDLQFLKISKPTGSITFVPPKAPPRPPAQSAPVSSQFMPSGRAPSCPQCGSQMVRRTARKGHRRGNQFWGCSSYPRCTGTRS